MSATFKSLLLQWIEYIEYRLDFREHETHNQAFTRLEPVLNNTKRFKKIVRFALVVLKKLKNRFHASIENMRHANVNIQNPNILCWTG